ncbi:MAG: hypothetical protein LBC27_00290 [Spirochaetaceae bacterium]|jgi:hypothetical protein|nr:hypothetical protein [Spirochaetaceae bacterium]
MKRFKINLLGNRNLMGYHLEKKSSGKALRLSFLSLCAALCMVLYMMAAAPPLSAQTTAGNTAAAEAIQFPQWSKDLRRAEIVAFGTIPFSWLISTVAVDISRTIKHNGDSQYLPWPLKPAGAPAMTNDDFIFSIVLTLGISALAAVVDHIIIKYKRKQAEAIRLNKSPQEPIIIRRPFDAANENTAEDGG